MADGTIAQRPITDYGAVTELPGALLSREQFLRYAHRYALGAELARNRRVLEVACGAGGGLGALANSARTMAGLDFSASVLPYVQAQYGRRFPLVQGDARALPFDNDSFDAILCFEAIYYLDDTGRFLHEGRRVLAPEGVLLLCQSNPDRPDFVPGDLSSRYPSAPELASSLKRSGFRTVELFGIMPVSDAGSSDKLVSRLRYLALRSGLVPSRGPVAGLLKQVAHGRLIPLPAELSPSSIRSARLAVDTTHVDPDKPDRVHRVLYAQASL